jgi:hypothetical protein
MNKPQDHIPRRDFYDKANILLPLIVSIVFGGFGGVASSWLSQKNEERKVHLDEIRMIREFLPYLAQDSTRQYALISLYLSNYQELAIRLCQVDQSLVAGSGCDQLLANARPKSTGSQKQDSVAEQPLAENEGWIYVGTYASTKWESWYLEGIEGLAPEQLRGRAFRVRDVTGSLNVRPQLPSPTRGFGAIKIVLKEGQNVAIRSVSRWGTGNYIWARVTY